MERLEKGTLFAAVYSSRGTLPPKRIVRAVVGDLVAMPPVVLRCPLQHYAAKALADPKSGIESPRDGVSVSRMNCGYFIFFTLQIASQFNITISEALYIYIKLLFALGTVTGTKRLGRLGGPTD